eukprot:16440414-Heterocapsa_arctica.AAC.1
MARARLSHGVMTRASQSVAAGHPGRGHRTASFLLLPDHRSQSFWAAHKRGAWAPKLPRGCLLRPLPAEGCPAGAGRSIWTSR